MNKVVFNLGLLYFIFFNEVYCQSECDLFINDKAYSQKFTEKKLTSYNIIFGLPVNSPQSLPIGYSIDVECASDNVTKLKEYYSFELNNVPVEININNCSGFLLIRNLSLSHEDFKLNYLKFFLNINTLRVKKTFEMRLKLTLNRRLGDGCMNDLIISASSSNSQFVGDFFDLDFEDNMHGIISLLRSNKILLLLIIMTIIILLSLIIIMCIFLVRLRNKPKEIDSSRDQLRMDSICFDRASTFENLESSNENNQDGTNTNQELKVTEEGTINENQKDEKLEKENEASDDNEKLNGFQILRQQLIEKIKNSS